MTHDRLVLDTDGLATGVIVGVDRALTPADADSVRGLLLERFPGVEFAVLGLSSGIVSFRFDPEAGK